MALLLALTLAFIGCPTDGGGGGGGGGGGEEPEPPPEGGGIQWGDELGMPKPALVGSGITYDDETGILSITASSNVGFTWTWAELSTAAGKEITQNGGNLFVYYVIEVTTPAAALTIKNPGAMSSNPQYNGADCWGQGKGAEYVLGDNTLSNYAKGGDKIVGGLYSQDTGRGWFEINPLVYPSGSTGVGFQHNFWCDMGGVKADSSVYKLKILSIDSDEPDLSVKVNVAAIPGVTAPVRGQPPVTAITDTAQYTGTIAWAPAVAETFAASTVYTATITLTAKEGFTFDGVAANFFTVAGATGGVTNAADSGVVTAVFPETTAEGVDTTVTTLAVGGMVAPAARRTPVAIVTETEQWTGAVTWTSGDPAAALTGNFGYSTVYTATITLTAKAGFTFNGVEADSFELTGVTATVSNPADSGVITAVFSATEAPPPSVKIKIGGVETDTELYTSNGTFVEIKDTDDATKTIGYTFTRGAAYEGSYAYLKVDLGTAKLSDFSQVKFTYAGVSGDIGYKDIQLRASATEYSGNMGGSPLNKPRYDTWATYQSGSATGVLSFGTGPQLNNNESDGPVTLKVEPTLAAALTGEIYVSIYFGAAATGSFGGADSPTVFSASNIEFIAADTTPITHDVYLTTKSANGIILGVVSGVADNGTIASIDLPQSDPAKYGEYYTAFIAEASSITGWKSKADDSDFELGTTTVTKDTVLYAIPGEAVAEFDLAALEALDGGITLTGNGADATFDADTKVMYVKPGSGVLFYFSFTDADITPATGETLKITYACVSVDKSDVTVKNNVNSWDDTNPQMYPTFTPSTMAAQTHELTIPVDNLAASATGVSFQNRNNSEFYIKIISVVSESE